MLVEEDTTGDSETTHTSEVVSYVAIQGNGPLTAVRRQTIIQRTTYRLAGQAIAVKVSGSPTEDGLYHLHSDHLGSASVLSNASGTAVPGWTAWRTRRRFWLSRARATAPRGGSGWKRKSSLPNPMGRQAVA